MTEKQNRPERNIQRAGVAVKAVATASAVTIASAVGIPEEAVVAAIGGVAIGSDVVAELLEDGLVFLDERKKIRIEIAFRTAIRTTEARLASDDWPEPGELNADVFEAALRAAQDATEELRSHHYGWFWTNCAWREQLSPSEALSTLKIAQGLSLRQWWLIKLIHDHPDGVSVPSKIISSEPSVALGICETRELLALDLIAYQGEKIGIREDGTWPIKLDILGSTLYDLLNLEELDDSKIRGTQGMLDSLNRQAPTPSLVMG